MNLELKIGSGTRQPASAFGIIDAVLVQESSGVSNLKLVVRGTLNDEPLCGPFEKISVYTTGVTEPRWEGWLDEAPRMSSTSNDRISYKFNGPHRWLERILFSQNYAGIVVIAGESNTGAATQVQTFQEALQGILNSSGLNAFINYDVSAAPTYEVPARPRSDISAMDALRTLMSFAPNHYIDWTFQESNYPTLILRATNTTAADKFLDAKQMAIIEASVNPRYDLLVSLVVINYMRDNAVAETQTSNVTGDADTFNANRSVSYTFDTSANLNVPLSGLADAIKTFRGKLHIDAEAVSYGIDWTYKAGQSWGFAEGLFGRFAGYFTTLHTIERDFATDQQRMTFGVPSELPIFEVYNRSDFDRSSIGAINTPSYTGGVNNVPFTPSGGSGGGGGGTIDPQSTITLGPAPFGAGQTVTLSRNGISLFCNTGFETVIDCGIITLYGPVGTCSIDGDMLNGKTVQFREIQNCDGQKAIVLMSDWYS